MQKFHNLLQHFKELLHFWFVDLKLRLLIYCMDYFCRVEMMQHF